MTRTFLNLIVAFEFKAVIGASASMYVELHSRSAFSFLEGASNPEEYNWGVRKSWNACNGTA